MSLWRRLVPPRRCPTCGVRLRKVIASNESFVQQRPRGGRRVDPRSPYAALPAAHTESVTIAPVYRQCETCGYRVLLRNIRIG